ncbi:MAG TPA: hypothetical protein VFO37_05785, partial [Chitinophagaceae bacterium]|nr:hypothetical protein [Chitinophagaceae bacterium]
MKDNQYNYVVELMTKIIRTLTDMKEQERLYWEAWMQAKKKETADKNKKQMSHLSDVDKVSRYTDRWCTVCQKTQR